MENGVTSELINEIFKNVRIVTGIADTSKYDLITYYIKAVCTNLLTRTNRTKFIDDMKYLVVELVSDKLTQNSANSIDNIQTVQSMSEAGRTVNFGIPDVLKNRLNLLAQKQLEENEKSINKFKLLYKTGGNNG